MDECIDRRLAKDLVGHKVRTVPQMGWAGSLDGALLPLVSIEFDVFLTVDRNLPFQQNLGVLDLAIVILQARSNCLVDLQPLVPAILEILPTAAKGAAVTIAPPI